MQVQPLQTQTLKRCASQADYGLYRAALEWDLIEPIVIENREDLRSERFWHNKLDPYHHQVSNLMTFCRRLPVTLLADDVGLGKTISAGLIASELMARKRVSKVLVVCPKLLMPQWREELDSKFGIPSVIATGSDLVHARPPENTGVVITTYHSARLHLNAISSVGYDMLVLDEAHKLRNLYGTENPPATAKVFREALTQRLFKYVLMLTATPIQNRLWDIYSLVDLLTVARGHENPFGSEGVFARRFIGDRRTEARRLRPESREEFRSIVYGYMSRVRRADAKLVFPDRKVQMHKVDPSADELELINLIKKPIQKLNRLGQISIAQALISSPHALASQLETMARNKTVDAELAVSARQIANRAKTTAKLEGLGALVDGLRVEQPDHWRMVVFTGRRETQTTIEVFLANRGIACGLINGESGPRNQETIARFRKNPPDIHVIVSTEAGSEGVNLQVANVVVNFDLPWNPMIVEQRIGRVQRLASTHASVCVFNVILRGTFEEYIVGRLMEKLQMASQAIGDVEALLEQAGLDDEEESEGFSENIRKLVIASLAGQDVEAAAREAEKSIASAKAELEREKESIDTMLGGMDGANGGPRSPVLPTPARSMDGPTFALRALEKLGAHLTLREDGFYLCELDGSREIIRFTEGKEVSASASYAPGTGAFNRLVGRLSSVARHYLTKKETGENPAKQGEEMARQWTETFHARLIQCRIQGVSPQFGGNVLLRVRANVAHDSYERLLEVPYMATGKEVKDRPALNPIGETITDVAGLGISGDDLTKLALADPPIAEFCRFYEERRIGEMQAAGSDDRKRTKLEQEFTPRIQVSLVGVDGFVHEVQRLAIFFELPSGHKYESLLTVIPSTGEIASQPIVVKCEVTGVLGPTDCFGLCEITGKQVLKHLLARSEISNRMALAEHVIPCALTGKRVLTDEVEKSAISGRSITKSLMKMSSVSGKRAEPEFFAQCEFTGSEVLQAELALSQASGKRYRVDQQARSSVSGKTGHQSEFVVCTETNQPVLATEAEHCEITGKVVKPGILGVCQITGKRVMPLELEKCAATGKIALKTLFVSSSLSNARVLEKEAIKSAAGRFCLPSEAKLCEWDGQLYHPEDLRICKLTNLPIHRNYIGIEANSQLEVLASALTGTRTKTEREDLWQDIMTKATQVLGRGRYRVESAELSPNGQNLGVCVEVKTLFGLKKRFAGLVYSIKDQSVLGKVQIGKREGGRWNMDRLSV